jgi:DNA-binding phage protein
MSLYPFDATRYLDSYEAVSEYMAAVIESKDQNLLRLALDDLSRALERGFSCNKGQASESCLRNLMCH